MQTGPRGHRAWRCHHRSALTDAILDAAASASAAVAVLPCCHDLSRCNAGPLAGWLDGPLAVDVVRAMRLEARGYLVRTQTISAAITPKNRLLIATKARSDIGEPAFFRGPTRGARRFPKC